MAVHAHGAGAAQALLQPLLLPQQLQVHRLQLAILHGNLALVRPQASQAGPMAAASAAPLGCRAGQQCWGCTGERLLFCPQPQVHHVQPAVLHVVQP